jgi:hypothetical protein
MAWPQLEPQWLDSGCLELPVGETHYLRFQLGAPVDK